MTWPIERLVIASHNKAKVGEMKQVLMDLVPAVELSSLLDYPNAPEPEEYGETYAENSAIKAASAARFTGEWSIADDAGLEVDLLDGGPGMHSKRFLGVDASFAEKMARILELLADAPESARTCRFRACVAICSPGAPEGPFVRPVSAPISIAREGLTIFEATCEGRVAWEPRGMGGFGYDPIFWLEDRGCTMAELTPEQKHEISHRGKALRLFAESLPL